MSASLIFIFKLLVIVLIGFNIFYLIKKLISKRLSGIIFSLVTLIILIILFFIPNYLNKLPILAKEAHHLSNANVNIKEIKPKKKLVVGIEGTYYPWNYVVASGEPRGFDVDVAKEIAKRLNVKLQIIIAPFQSLIANLTNKQYDMVVAALSITPERKKAITFTTPYAGVHVTFFGNKDIYEAYKDADLATLKKLLKGKTVGTQIGTTWPFFLNEEFKDIVEIKYYNTQPQLMMEVNSGRIDVGFSEIPSVVNFIDEHPHVTMFGPSLGIKDSCVLGEGIAIGLAKGDKALLKKINKVLEIMHEDGTIRELSLKHFNLDISYNGK